MSSRILFWVGGVFVVAAVSVGVLVQVKDSAVAPTTQDQGQPALAELPTFTSTPSPISYPSLVAMAAALEEQGLGCTDVLQQDTQEAGQPSIKEFGVCNLLDDPELNIDLWLFKNKRQRDKWVAVFSGKTYVVYGDNWIATPQDERRSRAIQGAIGGELIPAEDFTEPTPTP